MAATPTPDAEAPVSLPPLHALLIFNLASGTPDESPQQLAEVISLLQAWHIIPEVHLLGPETDMAHLVADGLARGLQMFIASGGDGTIESVANYLVGRDATLGILPTGTRNNLAFSLGIPQGNLPGNLSAAVALLRTGRCLKIDAGLASCGETQRWFFEAASVGLLSALLPASDEVQHGNLARLGDLLSTWVTFQPSQMRIFLDGAPEPIATQAHMALAANMPFFGARFQPAATITYDDGLVDLFTYAEMTKLDLIDYAVQITSGATEDPRVRHYRVRSFRIETDPPMPVNVDGVPLGEGALEVTVQPGALCVMAAPLAGEEASSA